MPNISLSKQSPPDDIDYWADPNINQSTAPFMGLPDTNLTQPALSSITQLAAVPSLSKSVQQPSQYNYNTKLSLPLLLTGSTHH